MHYHNSVKVLSRKSGRSSVQFAAYISGEVMRDDRLGQTFDHTSKEEVACVEFQCADRVPEGLRSPEKFWNAVEDFEKDQRAQVCRTWELALPNNLPIDEQKKICHEFSDSLIKQDGMPAVHWALHNKDGNVHAHFMAPMRDIDDHGAFMIKTKKEYSLDEDGQKIPILDPAKLKTYKKEYGRDFDIKALKGLSSEDRQKELDKVQKMRVRAGKGAERQWERRTVELNPWNSKDKVFEWRERTAIIINERLKEFGIEDRVDHRSYEEQGIDKIPGIHEGYAARRMGDMSERVQRNQQIAQQNEQILEIKNNIIEQQSILKKMLKAFEDFMQEVSHHGLTRTVADRINRLGSHSHRKSDERDLGYIRELGSEESGFGAEAVRGFLDKQRADEKDAGAARSDREAEQERLAAERSRREAEERARALLAEQELARKPKKTRSISRDEGPTLGF